MPPPPPPGVCVCVCPKKVPTRARCRCSLFPCDHRGPWSAATSRPVVWAGVEVQGHALAYCRQDSMATPGNFGGGSTGPGQNFRRITGAPPSAPGRGRAQSPVRQKPNPQATNHERQTRAALAATSKVFLFSDPIGDIPVSPSNFQREEAGASFGSGWTYCASRRCWESCWNYRRRGTTK
jgi:hypothetical protein